jgi:hypothetical protein
MRWPFNWILVTLWLLVLPAALAPARPPESAVEASLAADDPAGLFAYVHEDGTLEYLGDEPAGPALARTVTDTRTDPGPRTAVFTWSSAVVEPRRTPLAF